ncbi:hypothetical protein ACFV9E_39335 [Streptomyces sp. NPDC059835]|uniref:hypothetical protein n=1 Tax=unclassified Streptomyces TaxID=2593676 RepID=UPI003669CF54
MDSDEELLDVLLDRPADGRLKLISEDEARAVLVLLGILWEETRSAEVREAAEELRRRLASRLGPGAGGGGAVAAPLAVLKAGAAREGACLPSSSDER